MRIPLLIPLIATLTLVVPPTARMGAAPYVQLHVSSVMAERDDLLIQVLVARDKQNQRMRVTAESENYFASSELELQGEYAPRLEIVRFRSLPAGFYEVTGTVYDSRGGVKGSARTSLFVVPK